MTYKKKPHKEKLQKTNLQSNSAPSEGERIAKVLARIGIASRRDAEKLIEAGRIKVNGKRLDTPAFKVTSKDKIEFDGEIVGGKSRTRLWRYHKPSGLLTSHKDPQGRPTVFDNLPKGLPRVISVGRLDMTSEGLLLLTNNGELARQLELPATGWSRRYRARAYGHVTQNRLDTLKKGIMIDGVKTGPIIAELARQQGDNCWINVTIHEGKNREVRRALDTIGLRVNRLIRVSYGPFQLLDLGSGEVEEVKNKTLRDQVGHLVEIEPPKNEIKGGRKNTPYQGRPSAKKKSKASQRSGSKDRPQRGKSQGKSQDKSQGKPQEKNQRKAQDKKSQNRNAAYGGGSGRKINFKSRGKRK